MFGWLGRMFDSVAGRVDETVRRWVNDLLNGLYGFLHVIFQAVAHEWVGLAGNFTHWITTYEMLARSVWAKLYRIARLTIPAVIREYRTLIHDLTMSVQLIYHRLLAGLSFAENLSRRLVDGAIAWVQRNVWLPLSRSLAGAWSWITHEGVTAWGYISHPDRLAALIFGSLIAVLERNAWTVADRLGRFTLSLIARNLRQFAALIEDILMAIL